MLATPSSVIRYYVFPLCLPSTVCPQLTLKTIGGIGYVAYVLSLWQWEYGGGGGGGGSASAPDGPGSATKAGSAALVFVGAALCGTGAGLLWIAHGQIIMALPTEATKATYFSIFWAVFNVGACVGGLLVMATNWSTEAGQLHPGGGGGDPGGGGGGGGGGGDNGWVVLPVIPVVGQMFETGPVPQVDTRHLICSMDSYTFWGRHSATTPPLVTHERADGSGLYSQRHPDHPADSGDGSGDDEIIAARGGYWGPRLARHLYGKQTREGRFIFGGDRRVHPTQPLGYAHELPRLVEQMHRVPYEHFVSVFHPDSGVGAVPVERQWGGIMPFSLDGQPIIGPVPSLPSGVWCVTGLGGSGFLRGGMAGVLLAELMASPSPQRRRRVKEILTPAEPARFHRQRTVPDC
jgi:hypothetical protein